jgi:hypothetical protein
LFRKKRNRFKKPDKAILKFSMTCDSCKENCITENEPKTPTSEDSQKEPILAYGKPWKEG